MIEDDLYRSSSQFRYWSYTSESLAQLRSTTNELASERVRAAIRRLKSLPINTNGASQAPADAPESRIPQAIIETLTVEEEMRIVRWGCSKIIDIGDAMKPPIPMDIRATAIQYLRRFYLTNSPMTYHPKQIMMCALYLATKSDHWHISLHRFISELPNVTEDDIKAPEFLLLQGIRFTLDVRHPTRGLEGGVAEMTAMAGDGFLGTSANEQELARSRIGKAADRAKLLLRTAAQMTDAYFLFTPAQIWLSALLATDEELVRIFLDTKLDALGTSGTVLKQKLYPTLQRCAQLLSSYLSPDDDASERKEMRRIGKKLHLCQNPEKVDLVAVTKAKAAEKREGGDNSDAEKALKKRKKEREKLEKDGDVFGPELKTLG